jgi:hypothetical protein
MTLALLGPLLYFTERGDVVLHGRQFYIIYGDDELEMTLYREKLQKNDESNNLISLISCCLNVRAFFYLARYIM